MIIIKELHNHKDTSGYGTIIEEVLQSRSKAQEVFTHPDFSDQKVSPLFRQDVSPPDILDLDV